jgi:hypothetical protein
MLLSRPLTTVLQLRASLLLALLLLVARPLMQSSPRMHCRRRPRVNPSLLLKPCVGRPLLPRSQPLVARWPRPLTTVLQLRASQLLVQLVRIVLPRMRSTNRPRLHSRQRAVFKLRYNRWFLWGTLVGRGVEGRSLLSVARSGQ